MEMVVTLGDDDTLVLSTAEFRRGRENFENDSRSGHPAIAITEENIHHVYQLNLLLCL